MKPTSADDIRQRVATFVERAGLDHVDWSAAGPPPDDYYRTAADLGLLGLRYAPELGGAGLPYAATFAFIDELSRRVSVGTGLPLLLQTEFTSPFLHLLGNADQQRRFLAPAIAGELTLSVAITEAEGGSDLGALRTTATPVDGGYRLDGRKWMIGNARFAGAVLVVARLAEREAPGGEAAGGRGKGATKLGVFIVPRGAQGLHVGAAHDKIGTRFTHNHELALEGCFVPAADVLGQADQGAGYLRRVLPYERLAMAIAAVGFGDTLLRQAIDFAATRQLGAGVLLDNALWRHRLTELWMAQRAGALWVADALRGMDGRPDIAAITAAKVFTTENVARLASVVSQLFGARGLLASEPAGRAYADVRALTIGGGATEALVDFLSRFALTPSAPRIAP